MHNKINKLTLAIAAISATMVASQAMASGFQVREQSAKTLANALSNSTAGAEDASFMAYNPAAIGNIDGSQFSFGMAYIDAGFELKNGDASRNVPAPLPGPVPYTSTASSQGGETAWVPTFAYKTQLDEKFDLGVAIYAPYGLSTKYDDEWIGRYHGVETALETIDIQPTLNYRFSDRLSLAFGLRAEYADATLSQAVDLGGQGVEAGSLPPTAIGNHDGFAEVTGDDWGYGYTLGALFQATEKTRLGVSYRSEVELTLDGKVKYSATDAISQGVLAGAQAANTLTNGGGSADLTTPANLSFGVHHQLTDRLALMANAEWTEWSSFDELTVKFNDNTPDSTTHENWDDTWAFSVGANYALNQRWLLRAGLGYDQTPVPDSSHRTPRVPDSDRRWLTFGATYTPTPEWGITAGYMHIFASDVGMDLDQGEPGNANGGNLSGTYEVSADVFALSTDYRF